VDDTLLFLHVLSAFMLVGAVVMLSASVLGATIPSLTETVANRMWDISGVGTIGFGLWIVFREEVYDVTDGWILGALALWAVAGVLATLIRRSLASAAPEGGEVAAWPATAVRMHWLHAAITVGFLVLMIWKPGT
jgi:hypothetical protein